MATADQVIAWFEANAGLKEQPVGSNCTWISQWFWAQTSKHSALAPGCYAWCAVTVSRALNEAWGNPDVWQVAGIAPDWGPGFSYVPSVRRAFENAGRFLWAPSEAQRGDLVIFDWEGDGWGDHIGVFLERVDDETCLVWEGNTADSDISLRRRPYSLIAGFCRPPYDSPEEDDMFSDQDREDLNHIKTVANSLKEDFVGGEDGGNYWSGIKRFWRTQQAKQTGGVAIDIDALADKVADRIAERLAK